MQPVPVGLSSPPMRPRAGTSRGTCTAATASAGSIWLNNPVRMMEASGTSGMKAAANGGLNLSIGDGWWPEAFDGRNGWLLAEGEHLERLERLDPKLQR